MTNFWSLLLASIGLTLIVKNGEIFRVPRNWIKSKCEFLKKLFSCAQCLGFWCGLILAAISVALSGHVDLLDVYWCFIVAFGSSACSLVVDLIIDFLDISVFNKETYSNDDKKLLNE